MIVNKETRQEIDRATKLSAMLLTDSFVFYAFNETNQLIAAKLFNEMRYCERESVLQLIEQAGFLKEWKETHFTILGSPAWFIQENLDAPVPDFPGLVRSDVCTDMLARPEAAIAYNITKHQRSLMEQLTGGRRTTIQHTVSRLHTWFGVEMSSLLLLHFEGGRCCVYVRKEGKLAFFNVFDVTTPRDVLYFALAAMREAGLATGAHNVFVSGGIDVKTPLFQTLHYYLKAAPIVPSDLCPGDSFNQSGGEPHTWFIHHCVLSCAS